MLETAIAISILFYLIAIGYLYLFQRSILLANRFKVTPKSGFYIENTWIETRDLDRCNAIIYFGGNAQNNWVDIDLKNSFQIVQFYLCTIEAMAQAGENQVKMRYLGDSLKLYDKIRDRYKTITTIGRSLEAVLQSTLQAKEK